MVNLFNYTSGAMFFFSLLKKKIIQQMNATHPFLDKAYLWFSPKLTADERYSSISGQGISVVLSEAPAS